MVCKKGGTKNGGRRWYVFDIPPEEDIVQERKEGVIENFSKKKNVPLKEGKSGAAGQRKKMQSRTIDGTRIANAIREKKKE